MHLHLLMLLYVHKWVQVLGDRSEFHFSAMSLFSVKVALKEKKKKDFLDGCFQLGVDVNVPLGIFQFDCCQMESVFSAAARNH